MSYRDDRDADRARIAALEAELAQTRQRLAEAEGRRDQALVLATQGALARGSVGRSGSRMWGAPMELALSREFAGAFPTDRFEDLVETIREIAADPGRTDILKSSLTWSASGHQKSTGPFTMISVSIRDGKTRVLATDKLGQLAAALYGGVGGGVGGGAIFAPIMATAAIPVLGPAIFTAWIGGVYWGTRALYKRAARRRAERLQQVFDAVCAEIAKAI